MKAHQRIVREQAALEDGGADLFGQWWRGFVCDIKTANVREVSHGTAKAIIEKYEWLVVSFVYRCFSTEG